MLVRFFFAIICICFLPEAIAMSRIEVKPLVIMLMGPPGSGKGTHASPLSQYLGLPHISTGDLFREHMRNKTLLGTQAKSYIDKGHLVPDELVLHMLFERVAKGDCHNGYILDGFPRTLLQAHSLDKRLKHCRVVALNFNLPDHVIIERISGRIACKECGRPYHKYNDPPKQAQICDVCGGNLIQRDDDREEIVTKRLDVYRSETEPLIEHYSKQKNVLREIDSEVAKEQVFQQVLEALPLVVR